MASPELSTRHAAPLRTAPVLELCDLSKRFGDVLALDRVSLQVSAAELLAVVGPSGCGKSTMLRAVAGLLAADSGEIWAGGRQVAGPRTFVPPERRNVGVVFQDLALFPHLDVASNVVFGLRRRDRGRQQRVREVLDLVGLDGLGQRFPHELSGGEQQRVTVARAVVAGPALVWADEPTGNLDTHTAERVMQLLAELHADGLTLVLVTHDPAIGEAAQRLITMQDGSIISDRRPTAGDLVPEGQRGGHRPSPAGGAAAPVDVG